ncbi:MAG: galactose oxidase, partial [Isosphaeraceae bacterium]|nr:galactose oxidase [Isosphaeraceae bacterium]
MRSTTKRRTSLTKFVLLFAAGGLLLTLPPARPACAHFLWLATEGDGKVPAVRAFLSETPAPDLPEFLKTIASAKMSAGGRPLGWTKGEETYHVSLPTPLPKVIDGVCDLGVMTRKGATFRLVYTARVQLGPPPPAVEGAATDDLRLALLARSGETPVVAVTFRGRPLPGATIKVFPEDGEPIELKSDKAGELVVPDLAKGRAGVLAKWVEAQPGELEGKVYREARYYATLTVGPNVSGADPAPAVAEPFAELIEPVNSFGGALSGDWLYVYSGHVEGTHRYHEGATSRHFRRLNLKDRTRWEELPPGPSLQGVSLVAHGGKLYRVGGMVAKNRPSEPDDLVSVADFAVYDPATATWADLAPLPSPRSTHDAVVIGDKLYVVGGWSLPGGDAAHGEFHKDALVYDLSRP